jgi:hypothetical protein
LVELERRRVKPGLAPGERRHHEHGDGTGQQAPADHGECLLGNGIGRGSTPVAARWPDAAHYDA